MEFQLAHWMSHFGAWHVGDLHHSLELMQIYDDMDILGDIQKWWGNFVRTGQVWAFGIGLFVGYLVNKLLSY